MIKGLMPPSLDSWEAACSPCSPIQGQGGTPGSSPSPLPIGYCLHRCPSQPGTPVSCRRGKGSGEAAHAHGSTIWLRGLQLGVPAGQVLPEGVGSHFPLWAPTSGKVASQFAK